MTRTLLLIAALGTTACGALVATTNDAVAPPADTPTASPDTAATLPDTSSTPDVAAVDATLADRVDVLPARDATLDAPQPGCVPVGPPGATAIVTDADMAFPDRALTLEEWVDWDERMRNLDVIRCPIESRGSTTYLTTSRVAPDPTDDEVVGRMRRRLFVVHSGLATFDGEAAHACLVAWRARPLCGAPQLILLPECRHVLRSMAPTQSLCTDNFECAEGTYCDFRDQAHVWGRPCAPIPAVTVLAPGSGSACTPFAGVFFYPTPTPRVTLCPEGETCGQLYGRIDYRCVPVIAAGCRATDYFICAPGYRPEGNVDAGVTRCNPTPELHYPDHNEGESCHSIDHVDAGLGRGLAAFYDRCAPGLVCAFAPDGSTRPVCLSPTRPYRCDYQHYRDFNYAAPLQSYCNEDSGLFEPLLPSGALALGPDQCASQEVVSIPDGGQFARCVSTVSADGGYVY